jgi:GNAT superfamily N-acetyltransferase
VTLSLRPARPGDEAAIMALIAALAQYEKLEHAVESSAADIAAALFAENPRAFCDLAEVDGAVVGFALWFYTFSTFRGRHGIYLEDLFVRPEARRAGAGTALLRHLARRCVAEGLGRFEWAVLDWNAPAIAFYRAQGAQLLGNWTLCRVDGDALAALATKAEP